MSKILTHQEAQAAYPQSFIQKGSTVYEGAILEADTVLMAGSIVESGATLRKGSAVSNGVKIESGVTIGPNLYVTRRDLSDAPDAQRKDKLDTALDIAVPAVLAVIFFAIVVTTVALIAEAFEHFML